MVLLILIAPHKNEITAVLLVLTRNNMNNQNLNLSISKVIILHALCQIYLLQLCLHLYVESKHIYIIFRHRYEYIYFIPTQFASLNFYWDHSQVWLPPKCLIKTSLSLAFLLPSTEYSSTIQKFLFNKQ